jgi:hypothetical protein
MLSIVYPTLKGHLFKKKLIVPSFKENLVCIRDQEIELKSKSPKMKHFGFDFKKDGIEVYFLSDQLWVVIGQADESHPKAWVENRLIKAYECIPKHNTAISLVQYPSIHEDLLLFQACYAAFPSLKLLIGKDRSKTHFEHYLFRPLEKEAVSLKFQHLDLDIIKEYITLTCYKNLDKSDKPDIFHFSKKID